MGHRQKGEPARTQGNLRSDILCSRGAPSTHKHSENSPFPPPIQRCELAQLGRSPGGSSESTVSPGTGGSQPNTSVPQGHVAVSGDLYLNE